MIHTVRTNSQHPDFQKLVKKLDSYLAVIDGAEHSFYDQFNKIDSLNNVVVLYAEERPIACGAMKPLDEASMEVKRMYTEENFRGQGHAAKILSELESWAKEMGIKKIFLETGKRMEDAVIFYQKRKYSVIPNYGQYIGVENSICFEKRLL